MKRIEHIGIAVRDLKSAERIFEDILGEPAFKRESVPSESVNVSFFQTGESKVELLASTSPDGPIAKYIEKRGEGLHHLAFAVDDLNSEIERLQEMGVPRGKRSKGRRRSKNDCVPASCRFIQGVGGTVCPALIAKTGVTLGGASSFFAAFWAQTAAWFRCPNSNLHSLRQACREEYPTAA